MGSGKQASPERRGPWPAPWVLVAGVLSSMLVAIALQLHSTQRYCASSSVLPAGTPSLFPD